MGGVAASSRRLEACERAVRWWSPARPGREHGRASSFRLPWWGGWGGRWPRSALTARAPGPLAAQGRTVAVQACGLYGLPQPPAVLETGRRWRPWSRVSRRRSARAIRFLGPKPPDFCFLRPPSSSMRGCAAVPGAPPPPHRAGRVVMGAGTDHLGAVGGLPPVGARRAGGVGHPGRGGH